MNQLMAHCDLNQVPLGQSRGSGSDASVYSVLEERTARAGWSRGGPRDPRSLEIRRGSQGWASRWSPPPPPASA